MKHYIESIKTTQVLDHVTCDICGKKFKTESNGGSLSIEHEFELEYHYSEYYYEPVDSFYWEPDICMECFVNKFLPFFESIGLKPPAPDHKWDTKLETAIKNYQDNREDFISQE